MPISSGALGWPTSHFKKHDEYDDTKMTAVTTSGSAASTNQETSPYAWTIQLSTRDEYVGWRKDFDAAEAKRNKERKKHEKKLKKRIRKLEKQKQRDSAEQVLARQRRTKCVLLSLGLALVLAAVMFGAIALFTGYLEADDLGPPIVLEKECEGKWRTHYLAYNINYANGSTTFNCCYLPDVNVTYKNYVLSKVAVWPDGFVVPKSACLQHQGPCKFYETNQLFDPGTPPCSAAARLWSNYWTILAFTVVLSTM